MQAGCSRTWSHNKHSSNFLPKQSEALMMKNTGQHNIIILWLYIHETILLVFLCNDANQIIQADKTYPRQTL